MEAPVRTKVTVGSIIKKDKGISVEEARKQMLEAGQAPRGIAGETRKNAATGAVIPDPHEVKVAEVDEAIPASVPVVAPVPVVPVVQKVEIQEPERIETARFTAEIRQENGEWAAEIVYKNGGGTEKFTAPSRKALTLKLLEGKAHGTLKVREVVRREKYGTELDKSYDLPDGLSSEEFAAMPQAAKNALIDTVATSQAILFQREHPEYYGTDENSIKIQKFLSKRDLPYTARNLAYAFEELMDSEELDVRPIPKELVPSVSTITPKLEDSTPVVVAPIAASAATPVAATPVVVVRKRGTTGLRPGDTSSANTELESTEEGRKSSELSAAELKKLSPEEHRKLYQASLKRTTLRQF